MINVAMRLLRKKWEQGRSLFAILYICKNV